MQPLKFQNGRGVRFQLCDIANFPGGAQGWQYQDLSPGQAYLFVQTLAPDQLRQLRAGISSRYLNTAEEPQRAITRLLEAKRLKLYREVAVVVQADLISSQVSRDSLYLAIRAELNQILARELQQARQIDASYNTGSDLQKTASHGKALGTGLLEAGSALATWLLNINDVINPLWQLKRRLDAAVEIYEEAMSDAGSLNSSGLLQSYQHKVNQKDQKELIEALGFDPQKIDFDQFSEAWHTAWILTGDATLVAMITRFGKDYAAAQHSLEYSQAAGSVVFEVLLTILLAVGTGGVGAAANVGGKARHLGAFGRVGDKLKTLARLLEKAPREIRVRTKQKVKVDRQSEVGSAGKEKPVGDSGRDNNSSTMQEQGVVPDNKPNTTAMQVEKVSKPKLSPEKVDWNNSGPSGLQVKDPRDFAVGTRMYVSLLEKGLEPDLALTITRELLESGISEPKIVKLVPGDQLYKVVPKNGGPPREHSPYFMTKDMLDELPRETSDAASILGLPQAPDSFDIYSITAKTDVEVFQSEIAPFSVNGGEYLRSGGGTQTLVTNRGQFTSPRLLGD
ncbi:MAG: hypothetical protein WCY88_17655 [Spongiibacteraceae bacterium]